MTFGTQGKHRGPFFDQISLRMARVTDERIKDTKNRLIEMAVCTPMIGSPEPFENQHTGKLLRLLESVRDYPMHTVRGHSDETGIPKSTTSRLIGELLNEKLIKRKAKKWQITPDGGEFLGDYGR